MADENIRGGAELQAFLNTLPAKLEKNIMRSALGAGARVVAKEIRNRAPVGPPSDEGARLYGGYAGALRDSVRVVTKAGRDGRIVAAVRVGGKSKRGADVFYAHMVEFGTRPHIIKARSGGSLSFGAGSGTGNPVTEVMHPGTRPQPFVRPGFDAVTSEAINAVGAQIRKRLTAQGINTPAPEVP